VIKATKTVAILMDLRRLWENPHQIYALTQTQCYSSPSICTAWRHWPWSKYSRTAWL